MALSEGNPEPSPQACLSTYGSWPLHLQDHVNCLHRCFTQCWIKAGVPQSAKAYSGTFLPLLQPTRRIWEAVGAMLGCTPSYPEVFFSVPPTPHTSEVVKSQRWLLSATCLDRDILLGEDLLCWQSVCKGYNEYGIWLWRPLYLSVWQRLISINLFLRRGHIFGAPLQLRGSVRVSCQGAQSDGRDISAFYLFPVASLLILACSTCRKVNSCHDVGRRQAVGWGGAPHVQDSHFLLCHLTLVTCQSAFTRIARASHCDVCEKDVWELSSMFCWDIFPISHLLIAH